MDITKVYAKDVFDYGRISLSRICRGTFTRLEYRILFVFQRFSFNGATNVRKNLKTGRVQFLSRMSKNLILFVRVDKSLPFGRANSSSKGSIKRMQLTFCSIQRNSTIFCAAL